MHKIKALIRFPNTCLPNTSTSFSEISDMWMKFNFQTWRCFLYALLPKFNLSGYFMFMIVFVNFNFNFLQHSAVESHPYFCFIARMNFNHTKTFFVFVLNKTKNSCFFCYADISVLVKNVLINW